VVLAIAGSDPIAFSVNDQRRGERLTDLPSDPTVGLAMDREAFILLAGGRRAPEPGAITITGDQALGQRIVDTLAVTP
jgi:hypothetical protein